MQKSESIKELATALAKAQGEIENASKNSNNPAFKSKYADLAEVLNTVRPVLAKNGLSVAQFPSLEGTTAHVETLLMHSSGEWISNTASAPLTKQDAQGVGSVTTYLRRYSLAALTGVAQEDDDGNSAATKPPSHAHQQHARQPEAPATYPQAEFDKNFPAWSKAIASGKKTHADVIAVIESKAPLSEKQKSIINAVQVTASAEA